jgi:hypothetical protein
LLAIGRFRFPLAGMLKKKSRPTERSCGRQLDDVPTRHFSANATYQTAFSVGELESADRVLLDRGRVGVIVQIEINGNDVGTIWAAPFQADVTDHVKAGENRLKIAVTNTQHNRLAYDAFLPKGEQKTWTYAAPPADSALDQRAPNSRRDNG